jgi:hypothetical protein
MLSHDVDGSGRLSYSPCHKYVTDSVEKRVNYGIGAERKKQGKRLILLEKGWGDSILGFIRCLWHNNIAPQLEELTEITKAYCPELCPPGA